MLFRSDAEHAKCVVLLTEEWVDYPNYPASIAQDQVDLIVQEDGADQGDRPAALRALYDQAGKLQLR